jgi:hypothetical protein
MEGCMKTALNLLPLKYRRERLTRRRVIQWSLVLVAALVTIGAARWFRLHEYRALERQLAAVSREGSLSQGKLRVTDCRVVDLQAMEVAQNRSDDASQAGTVTLTGVSLDSPAVAEFEDSLVRSGLFAEVKLMNSKERDQSGTELYDYEVRCEL